MYCTSVMMLDRLMGNVYFRRHALFLTARAAVLTLLKGVQLYCLALPDLAQFLGPRQVVVHVDHLEGTRNGLALIHGSRMVKCVVSSVGVVGVWLHARVECQLREC